MTTALVLRQLSKNEQRYGSTILLPERYDSLEVAVRLHMAWGIRLMLINLQSLAHRCEGFASVLHQAGLDSRNIRCGHGYLMIHSDKIVVPWTNWSERDSDRTWTKDWQKDQRLYYLDLRTQSELRKVVFDTAQWLKSLATSFESQSANPAPFNL